MKKITYLLIISAFLLSACGHLETYNESNFQSPVLKFKPKLYYPHAAQKTNRSGISTILITVTEEGKVKETSVLKSSGHKDLDLAAENYCKELVFRPATLDGDPILTKMRWLVRFDLTNLVATVQSKIREIKSLYNSLKKENADKLSIQKKILEIHNTVIGQINDGEMFNYYAYNVIQGEILKNWENISNDFPLSFLLYHDFITRFGDYENIDSVKSQLMKAVESELNYINTSENIQMEFGIDKKMLVRKIESFIKNNYS